MAPSYFLGTLPTFSSTFLPGFLPRASGLSCFALRQRLYSLRHFELRITIMIDICLFLFDFFILIFVLNVYHFQINAVKEWTQSFRWSVSPTRRCLDMFCVNLMALNSWFCFVLLSSSHNHIHFPLKWPTSKLHLCSFHRQIDRDR